MAYANLSTFHIGPMDAGRLEELSKQVWSLDTWRVLCSLRLATQPPLRVAETEHGFLICLSDWERAEIVRRVKLSSNFADLVAQLQKAGFAYLRLDADAPVVKGVKVFEW